MAFVRKATFHAFNYRGLDSLIDDNVKSTRSLPWVNWTVAILRPSFSMSFVESRTFNEISVLMNIYLKFNNQFGNLFYYNNLLQFQRLRKVFPVVIEYSLCVLPTKHTSFPLKSRIGWLDCNQRGTFQRKLFE